jgi:F-type H+-transporting ATPase subunit alpha
MLGGGDWGWVKNVGDGIVSVENMQRIGIGEVVEIYKVNNSKKIIARGLILSILNQEIKVILFNINNSFKEQIKTNDKVKKLKINNYLRLKMDKRYIGRVINPLGEVIDQEEIKIKGYIGSRVENRAPEIIERRPINRPLSTGYTGIDTLIPLGRGQRELIIGDRQTGKTAICLDAILNSSRLNEVINNKKKIGKNDRKVYSVYIVVGQKRSTVINMLDMLRKKGAMNYTVIVATFASDSAFMQYIAPYAGCAVAEILLKKLEKRRGDVMVIYDDLSKQAVAYRQMSLLLLRPSGREAYPGDIFYLHSRLLERAAQNEVILKRKKVGIISISALPVVETQLGDISAYIPTNVISITDGQIFLETELLYSGILPAINWGLSVSRVGSTAQTKQIKKLSGSLKLNLSQYRVMKLFAYFESDLDELTKRILEKGSKLIEILKQEQYKPLSEWKQEMRIYSGVNNIINDLKLYDIKSYMEGIELYGKEYFTFKEKSIEQLNYIKYNLIPKVILNNKIIK